MRRLIAFPCCGETLLGTLDEAAGPTGLLIVSGGNELRAGAHRGMAMLAGRLAAANVPVFRYDRRGVGDASGINRGFLSSAPDLAAAVEAFREAAPHATRIVGFGNCDGASALALFGRAAEVDALCLANPWLTDEADDLPPAAAIRSRYAERLRDPRSWWALMRGKVELRNIVRGLRKVAHPPAQDVRVLDAVRTWGGDARILLARGDATALAYAAGARRAGIDLDTTIIETASHSFARTADQEALFTVLLAACR